MWWKKKKEPSIQDLNEDVKMLADIALNADPPDYNMAFMQYKLAAEEGDDKDAQYNLASMYATGRGTEKNYMLAAYWYKKVADQGDEEAKKLLKKVWLDYTNENIEDWTYAELFEQTAKYIENFYDEQNVFDLIESLSVYYCDKQNHSSAFKCFQAEAIFGKSSEAMYNLGICFNRERGVEQDDLAALYWLDKAADCGNVPAKTHRDGILDAYIHSQPAKIQDLLELLASWCERGTGEVPVDKEKSEYWREKARQYGQKV
jgi:TPR repeat protein